MKKYRIGSLLIFVVLLAVTACGTPAASDTPTSAPTVDTQEIVEAVLLEIEAQAPEPVDEPAPTVDTGAIVEEVLAEIAPQLARPASTPVPTVDASAITDVVMAEVEAQAALLEASESIEDSLINLYLRANPAVVFIVVPSVGSGSGFVLDELGHIVTNNHVVADGETFEVVFSNGERRRAELIGADADSDLAVIQVDQMPDGIEPLPLADPYSIQVGQFVVAIGNPFGEQGSMSLGIVSGLGRSLRSQRGFIDGSSYSLPQVIQTDAPINPGNSGGPLLNLDGEVIGVNAAIRSTTGTNSGVGFSIPVAAVRQIVPSLIEQGTYVYPYMGVGFVDEISLGDQDVLDLPQTQGAYVLSVTRGSPADEAGLIPANPNTRQGGDLVVQIDDQKIRNFSDLNSYLVLRTTVGQTIEVTVLRDGELVVLPLTLGARP